MLISEQELIMYLQYDKKVEMKQQETLKSMLGTPLSLSNGANLVTEAFTVN